MDPVTLEFHSEALERSYLVFAYGVYVRNRTSTRATAAAFAITAVVVLWKIVSLTLFPAGWSWLSGTGTVLASGVPCALFARLLYALNMKGKYYPRSVWRSNHETAMLGE